MANRVTGDPVLRTRRELNTASVTRFLQRHARAPAKFVGRPL